MKKFCKERDLFYEEKSGRFLSDEGKLFTKSECKPHTKSCACNYNNYCPDCMNETIACTCMLQSLKDYWK